MEAVPPSLAGPDAAGPFLTGNPSATHGPIPTRLRCEALVNPLAIDAAAPRLSWNIRSNRRGETQTAWQILTASSPDRLEEDVGNLWDSGKQAGDAMQIAYAGAPLSSLQRCHWKVRVWDHEDAASEWSEPAEWTMGLLNPSDWKGEWIGDADALRLETATASQPVTLNAPWLRTVVELDQPPERALLHVASFGYHELYLNGRKVRDAVLSPSISDASRRVRYVAYEVAHLLQPGRNVIGLWICGVWSYLKAVTDARTIWAFLKDVDHGPAVSAQLTALGQREPTVLAATGPDWKTSPSSRSLHFPGGTGAHPFELHDAAADALEWSGLAFDDRSWSSASRIPVGPIERTADNVPPNRITEEIPAVSVEKIGARTYEVDLGRCLTGWLRMRLEGERGQQVQVRSYDLPRTWEKRKTFDQEDQITLSGREDLFCQKFNYRSFRWAVIEGLDEPPRVEDIGGLLIHNDYERDASFSCSNELLNWISDTMCWTFRCLSSGGYVADCSHREKRGYGGEGSVTVDGIGLSRFDLQAFHHKWLTDWRDAQLENGNLLAVAPQGHHDRWPWFSAAIVTLPWTCYASFGDVRLLEENYPAITAFLGYLEARIEGGLIRQQEWENRNYNFLGDWCSPIPGSDFLPDYDKKLAALEGTGIEVPAPRRGKSGELEYPVAERTVANNCFAVQLFDKAASIAEVLGRSADAARHRAVADGLRKRVFEEFYRPEPKGFSLAEQPYLSLLLNSGAVPEDAREEYEATLERNILEKSKGHNMCGVLGTWNQFRYLSDRGRHDLIYTMLTKTSYPSYGYMRDHGATAIWERWWPVANSQIHSSYLAIAWFTEGLAGIRSAEPGYRTILIQPAVVGDVRWVQCTQQTVRGPVVSNWRRDGAHFKLHVEIPPNTTATVRVPAARPETVTESRLPARAGRGVTEVKHEPGAAVVSIGAGIYQFESELFPP